MTKIKTKEEIRNTIKEFLRTGIVQVNFTKKNGTDREMFCTTNASKIPKEHQTLNEGKKQRAENPETLNVYDIENGGWRSFRIDSVKTFYLCSSL